MSHSIKINPKPLIYLAPLKFSYPLYLTNGEELGKINTPQQSKPLKTGGGSPQNPKIKIQIWWEHPYNLKLKL
jgi:hypothetical protein